MKLIFYKAQIWMLCLGHITRSLLWIIPSASVFSSGLFFDSQSALSGTDWFASFKEEYPQSDPWSGTSSNRIALVKGSCALPVVVTHTTTHGSDFQRSLWKMILTQWQRKLGQSICFHLCFFGWQPCGLCSARLLSAVTLTQHMPAIHV